MTDLGTDTIGGAGYDNVSDNVVFCKCPNVLSANGVATSILGYGKQFLGPSPTIRMGIYQQTSIGHFSLVAQPASNAAVAVGAAWISQAISASLTAGVQYYIGIICPAWAGGAPAQNDAQFAFATNSGATELYYQTGPATTLPSTATPPNSATNERWSVYVVVADAATVTPALIASTEVDYAPTIGGGIAAIVPNTIGSIATTYPPSVALASNGYSSAFPLTENPISQSGIWVNGLADGLDWHNVRTLGGFAAGTMLGTETGAAQYSDSIAILKGGFPADTHIRSVVHSTASAADYNGEVEHFHRAAISAHVARGYEINWKVAGNANHYCTIVRWNGALAAFTTLATVDPGAIVDGDVLESTIVGSVISAYVNGRLVNQATDATWTNGNPGMGFFLRNLTGVGDSSTFGFSSFSVLVPQGILPQPIGSAARVFTPTVGPVSAELDMGILSGEGASDFPAPRTITYLRAEVTTIDAKARVIGTAEPRPILYVGSLSFYQKLPDSAAVTRMFVVWTAYVGWDYQIHYTPSTPLAGVHVDGVVWKFNRSSAAHAWIG